MQSNKLVTKLCATISILLIISLCYTNVNAQPPTGPGGGSPFPDPGCDIDSTCPVDAWVFIIAMVALIFAAMQIHKKQKALLN